MVVRLAGAAAAAFLIAGAVASAGEPRGAEVFGYFETVPAGAAPDFAACTHAIDAFLLVDRSGAVRLAHGPRPALVRAARAAGCKVLLSVGGATVPGDAFAAVARDEEARRRFLDGLWREVAAGRYDGVDVDWEFPALGEGALHAALVEAVRGRLETGFARERPGERPIVTAAVSPASRLLAYDFPALARAADRVIHMGYDFRNPALGPWASDARLWPDGAERPIEGSVRGAASEIVRRGVPREKLVVALPLFASDGRPWAAVRAPALAAPGALDPRFLEREVDGAWVSDAAGIEAKARAILAGHEIAGGAAGGVALWQLGHQGAFHDLTDAVRRALGRREREEGGR